MKQPLRILTYTNLFPNRERPNLGIFIKHRMETFARQTGAKLDVVAPVPYFPTLPWHTRWDVFSRIPAEEKQNKIRVYHPRYIVLPKIGMQTHGRSLYWATRKLVYALQKENHYQLIDAHWIYPDGWAAVKIAKELGIPVVLSARGNDINEYPDFPRIRPLIRWCLTHCDHIISVCQALKDLMLPLGVPASKISVVGNGVDVERFFPMPKIEARQRLGLPVEQKILLSVGILEPRKGHHVLIEALHVLKEQQYTLPRLYIVGSGLFADHLKTLSKRLGVEEAVGLVGEVANQELRMWYSAADILCLASDREGWPNVLLEAIACGTPVVTSRVFGTPEIVTSSDIGLLVNGRTPAAFAQHLAAALQRSWDVQKLIAFARQYSWEKTARGVGEVFWQVLTQRNSKAAGVEQPVVRFAT